mgnify:CR=1 FL=1
MSESINIDKAYFQIPDGNTLVKVAQGLSAAFRLLPNINISQMGGIGPVPISREVYIELRRQLDNDGTQFAVHIGGPVPPVIMLGFGVEKDSEEFLGRKYMTLDGTLGLAADDRPIVESVISNYTVLLYVKQIHSVVHSKIMLEGPRMG